MSGSCAGGGVVARRARRTRSWGVNTPDMYATRSAATSRLSTHSICVRVHVRVCVCVCVCVCVNLNCNRAWIEESQQATLTKWSSRSPELMKIEEN